jgi:hypothetical protein
MRRRGRGQEGGTSYLVLEVEEEEG